MNKAAVLYARMARRCRVASKQVKAFRMGNHPSRYCVYKRCALINRPPSSPYSGAGGSNEVVVVTG